MSDRIYKLIKTVPNTVLMELHSISNRQLSKKIILTDRIPQQALPLDWALDIFLDSSLYEMYRRGYITFDDNESILKEAIAANVYFGDALDFTPAKPDQMSVVLKALNGGNRAEILKTIDTYGRDSVFSIAQANVNSLTHNVITMLEGIFKVQFTVDGE